MCENTQRGGCWRFCPGGFGRLYLWPKEQPLLRVFHGCRLSKPMAHVHFPRLGTCSNSPTLGPTAAMLDTMELKPKPSGYHLSHPVVLSLIERVFLWIEMWFPACRNSKLVVSYGCSLRLIPITSINFVQPLFISALLLMNHICLMIFPNPGLVGQTTTFRLANWISRVFGLIIFQTYFALESQCCKKTEWLPSGELT